VTDAQNALDTVNQKDQKFTEEIARLKAEIARIKTERIEAYNASLFENGEGPNTSKLRPLREAQQEAEKRLKETQAAQATNAQERKPAQNNLAAAQQSAATVLPTLAAAVSSAAASDNASNANETKRKEEAAAAQKAIDDKQAELIATGKRAEEAEAKLKALQDADAHARANLAFADSSLASARTRASRRHMGRDDEKRSVAPYEKAAQEALSAAQSASAAASANTKTLVDTIKSLRQQLEQQGRELDRLNSQANRTRTDSSAD
jgi:chromosome segregation ATPase